MADLRLSTLQVRANTTGVTLLGYITAGKPVGLTPQALYPTAGQIGAASTIDLAQGLSLKQNVADRGLANGYASLGPDGKVPSSQLPAGGGGGSGGSVALSDNDPSPLASANPGVSTLASRSDHVHSLPSAQQIGAAPVSHTHNISGVTGLQLALDGKLNVSLRGVINGVASLGADGLVPTSQLPPTTVPQAALDAKADAAQTTAALNLKADLTYVNTQLALKLDASDSRIANAVTTSYLNVPSVFSANLTVAQADNNKTRRCTSTGDVTVTLPAVSVGTTIKFTQGAAGRMTFAAGAGQTLESRGNLITTNGKGSNVIAHCQATNTWNISGDLV